MKYWYYLTHSWGNKWFHTFPKDISPKVNKITRLEFELAYDDVTVQLVRHCTTGPSSLRILVFFLLTCVSSSWQFGLTYFPSQNCDFFYLEISRAYNMEKLFSNVTVSLSSCFVEINKKKIKKENKFFLNVAVPRTLRQETKSAHAWKIDFLALKRNSFSLPTCRWYWTDFLLLATCR